MNLEPLSPKSGVEGRVRIRNKIGGAVQAVGTIRLGVRVDAVAARAAGTSQNLVSRSHYVNRGRPFWPSGGRRADAACAFSREPRDVGAPRAVYQIGKQLGQAGAHSTEFCTLDMSSADGSDLHAHDGQFAAGPARYNSVMRGCKTTQPCSQPFLLLDTLDHSRLQVLSRPRQSLACTCTTTVRRTTPYLLLIERRTALVALTAPLTISTPK